MKLTIAQRLTIGCTILLVVSILSSSFILFQTNRVAEGVSRTEATGHALVAVSQYVSALTRNRIAIKNFVTTGAGEALERYERTTDELKEFRREVRDTLRILPIPGARETADRLLEAVDRWRNEVVTRQIEEMGDPFSVDLARLRSSSPVNVALWETIRQAANELVLVYERAQEDNTSAQGAMLMMLGIAVGVVGVVLIAVSLGLLIMSRTAVIAPLRGLVAVTDRLRERDWDTAIPMAKRSDEIGQLGQALDTLRDAGREADRMAAEREAAAAQKLEEADAVRRTTATFRNRSTELLSALGDAGSSLSDAAENLDTMAGASHDYTQSVSSAAEATEGSMQTVASAIEEMSISVREISEQVQSASSLTRSTTEASEAAVQRVNGLAQLSEKINDVIALINGIAGEINLLALNATIESARAGEAGKGFAVVAQQVKQLADQTAKATEEITRVIKQVSSEIYEVVSAMEEIGESIAQVNQSSGAVAAAVEQQSSALDEITSNVTNVTNQTATMTESVRGVEEKVGETHRLAYKVSDLSKALKEHSEDLGGAIEHFVDEVVQNDNTDSRAA